jgi:hypothetical protein
MEMARKQWSEGELVAQLSVGRLGKPEEVGEAIMLLVGNSL